MKVSRLSLRLILNGFGTQFCYRNGTRVPFYSTNSAAARWPSAISNSVKDLFQRISPVGDPEASIAPILDKWIEEGGDLRKDQLLSFVRSLRRFRRHGQALQISEWMTDKRYFKLTNQDVAIRLDLICKVRGIEAAEKFFNNVAIQFRTPEVYGSLLNCYARAKHVEKAEAVMQKMRDLGLHRFTLSYNVLLKLYQQTGNFEKLDVLMKEMEEKGIPLDKYTYGTRIIAYATLQNVKGIDRTIRQAELDSETFLDWRFYATAAYAYRLVALFDKALVSLKKCEDLVPRHKDKGEAYSCLLADYAAMGKKDDVLRIWERYKEQGKVYSKGYLCMVAALVKLDDIETAETIFEEWGSSSIMNFDIRLPNLLLGAYAKRGATEKAETVMERIIVKGYKPEADTWYHLSQAHLHHGRAERAVEAMKEAILISKKEWKPAKASVVSCLKLLKDEDMERAEEFIELLRVKDIVSGDFREWLGGASVQNPDLGSAIEAAYDALHGTVEACESSNQQVPLKINGGGGGEVLKLGRNKHEELQSLLPCHSFSAICPMLAASICNEAIPCGRVISTMW